jgi:hypothetical protein
LQAALVISGYIKVATWLDNPDFDVPIGDWGQLQCHILGADHHTAIIAYVPLSIDVNEVTARLAVESNMGAVPILWLDQSAVGTEEWADTRTIFDNSFHYYLRQPCENYLRCSTSGFPANSNTGVIR